MTIPMQDEGQCLQSGGNDNAHIPKVRTGKKKLRKADLEGPAFNLVKAFHKNNVFLQYQMDECHKLLTNKVDLGNPEGHQILRKYIATTTLEEDHHQVRDSNDTKKADRLNDLHKFSDGTNDKSHGKADHMDKDCSHLFEYNKGMDTRSGQKDDKRRSKDFIICR
ncbi:hypothetical protein Tco_1394791 [Tanacetum coccineum]